MSKIVIAANAMIENKDKISLVIPGKHQTEIFFVFDGRYKWSVLKRNDGHFNLTYYPGRQTIEELASFEEHDWIDFTQQVVYTTKDLATRESMETFQELYSLLNDLKYGMDGVLDDIINSLDF